MKIKTLSPILLVLVSYTSVSAQPDSRITASYGPSNEIVVAVDPQIHIDYGLSYPMTYQVIFPESGTGLRAYRRFSATRAWGQITEKTSDDFFNGIEAVRFDYAGNAAYLSVAFSNVTDSIFLKVTDIAGLDVPVEYGGISQYYDNRDAAVTCSADDWHPAFNNDFLIATRVFRDYHLWLSVAIVTEWCDVPTWRSIQSQLDSGYVEAVSHGRNHLHAPYPDVAYEVEGARQDIVGNLRLPAASRMGDREYVYAWIAPYGDYDDAIAAQVSASKYLVSRMYYSNFHAFSEWDETRNTYGQIGVSKEVGTRWEGTTNLAVLNGTFDMVRAVGGVYHLMCHPHVLVIDDVWEADYIWSHLAHISNRKNIWYVGLGHLYLYHFLQDNDNTTVSAVTASLGGVPTGFVLSQNFPNPFNPATEIRYGLPEAGGVTLRIFDLLGREVTTLLNGHEEAGYHSVIWNGRDAHGRPMPSGTYYYRLETGDFSATRKLVLLK